MYFNHIITNDYHEESYSGDLVCFAVADGVGGASYGDKASLSALQALDEWQSSLNITDEDICNVIIKAFDGFNNKVIELSDEIYAETGTTLTLLVFYKDSFYLANVGDSPAFRVRDKNIIPIYERQGENNMLHAYLGNRNESGSSMVSITKGSCQDGDLFFICTDGVVNALKEKQLNRLLRKKNINIEKIINKVKKNIPQDNCSGILFTIVDERSHNVDL